MVNMIPEKEKRNICFRPGSLLCLGCKERLLNSLHLPSLLTSIVIVNGDDDNGGMKVLTWLSAERRGMERVRPCPSIG